MWLKAALPGEGGQERKGKERMGGTERKGGEKF